MITPNWNTEYVEWICEDCAVPYKKGNLLLVWLSNGICDVCNSWKPLRNIRHYGSPVIKCNFNNEKIKEELQNAALDFRRKGMEFQAHIIDEVRDNL